MIYFSFTGITCSQRSLLKTQNVNITSDKQSYTFYEAVTMSCNYGFNGNNVTARCTDINTWSENSPTCTRKIFHSKHVKVDWRFSTNTSLPLIIG